MLKTPFGLSLASLLPLLAAPTDDPMGWTGVLDEQAFAALHELRQGEAPELFGEEIELGEGRAYLSLPPDEEPIGALVVIHEWWGLNANIKHWSDRLAADGYIALAVDLYGGEVATTRDEAMGLMQGADEDSAMAVLLEAHRYLDEELGEEQVPIGRADREAPLAEEITNEKQYQEFLAKWKAPVGPVRCPTEEEREKFKAFVKKHNPHLEALEGEEAAFAEKLLHETSTYMDI